MAYAQTSASASVNADPTANPPPTVFGNVSTDEGSERLNELLGSFNEDATGILQIQENNGNSNALDTAMAVTVDTSPVSVETHADVRGFAEANVAEQTGVTDPDRANLISDSFEDFAGVLTVQQNNGDNNSIGAASAVVASLETAAPITQTASVDNTVVGGEDPTGIDDFSIRDNTITSAFSAAEGVLNIQQNNGSGNSIGAAFSVSAGTDASALEQTVQALGTTDFFDTFAEEAIQDTDSIRTNLLENAFLDAQGVVTVQQNNGDGNAIGAATGVAASLNGGPGGSATQTVEAVGSLSFGFTFQDNLLGERDNTITNSFTDIDGLEPQAQGIVTAQQNNGGGNAIDSATGVHANEDDTRSVDMTVSASAEQDSSISSMFGAGDPAFPDRANLIENGSFDAFEGLVTAQQNNGDNNALSAASGVQASLAAEGGDVDLGSQADAAVHFDIAELTEDLGSVRDNTIDTVFNAFQGVATLQQNNGDGNAMSSATAVTADVDAENITQSADNLLSDVSTASQIDDAFGIDAGLNRQNDIYSSFNDEAEGIVTAQQNNGNNNAIGSATAVLAGTGSGGPTGDLTQAANASGSAAFSESTDFDDVDFDDPIGARSNLVEDSFIDAGGIVTAQQNNGDANGIGNGTSVQADLAGHTVTDFTVAAESSSFSNDALHENSGGGSFINPDRGNLVTGSFHGFEGIATLQQNNGDGNGMATATGVLAQVGPDGGLGSQTVSANASPLNGGAVLNGTFDPVSDFNTHRDNTLVDIFNDAASGIVTAQQNNGNTNALSAATGVAAGVAPSDVSQLAEAIGDSSANFVDDLSLLRSNTLGGTVVGTFDGFEGVVTIQQNNGDGNFMGASTAVAASLNPSVGLGQSDATASPLVDGNDSVDTDDFDGFDVIGLRENTIYNAFNGLATGIVTVQQNNGSGNALAAATAVTAATGGSDDPAPANGSMVEVTSTTTDSLTDHLGAGDDLIADRHNLMTESFTEFEGVVTAQQNNGDNNALGVATAVLAALVDSGDLATELQVSGESSLQFGLAPNGGVGDLESHRHNEINTTLDGAMGLANLQQNNGNANALSIGNAVAANISATTSQDALVEGLVEDNLVSDESLLRNNLLDDTFFEFEGVLSVQQNNGDGNVLGIGNTVLANLGPAATVPALTADVTGAVLDSAVDVATTPPVKDNTITSTLNGAFGVTTLQQNNGSNNVMGAATSAAANQLGGLGEAVSTASLSGTVAGTETTTGFESLHSNNISVSFSATAGVNSVQQNNGNSSVMGSSIVATANF